jgi:HlyD family secretion protein
MKKRIMIISAVVIVAVIAVLVLKPFTKKESAVTFDTVKVKKGNIANMISATGTIEAITTVEVGTQVSGILQHVYVDFNDNVKQGQLLAKLDETSLKAQLEQSQSQVDQAQAQLNFQEATYKRLKVLYDKKLIAQADYDQALYNYENSKATLNNARSNYSRSKVNLDYATITSPIDGVVLNRAVEEGQTVAASFNTPTLFTIVNDLTQMEVQASVDEADIGLVKKDQRVEFTVSAYPDLKFEGNVSEVRVQPVITNNVVTYVVILNAPNPEKKLMPGMTATANIYVEEKANTLFISGKAVRFVPNAAYLKKMMAKMQPLPAGLNSAQAIVPGQAPAAGTMPQGTPPPGMIPGGGQLPAGTKTVWVKDDKGQIHPFPVTLGIDNGSDVEILSGLKEGDDVVISMNDSGAKTAAKTNNGPQGPFPF